MLKLYYRRTSLFAVDTFCQLTANTETANTESNNAVVLKLGVATLLRVANCQKRVAKFDKKENLTYIPENMAKIRVLTWYFSHLEGRKIP
jgi:hypothetical protein